MSNLYTKDSIESLDPRSFVRLKPFVYCGDMEYSTQLLIEGFSNAVDEFNLGHGSTIKVIVSEDGTCSIEDEGQGFLVNEVREDSLTVFEAAMSVLNTSAKYNADGTYEGTSLGAFGIGCKLITFLCSTVSATTYRDGKYEALTFKDGLFEKRDVGTTVRHSGTIIMWKPDPQFFTSIDINYDVITKLFKTVSSLCPGLTVEFKYKDKPVQIYYSTNGLNDLVDEDVNNIEILKNRFVFKQKIDKSKIDLILTYTNKYSSVFVPYVNTGLTESGPHITQLKTIITREFNKFFRDKGYLKDKDENLSGDDIQEGLYVAFNLTVPSVKYDAQVKSRVTGIECRELYAAMTESLQGWLAANEKEIKVIAEKAILARIAREKAKQARESVRDNKERKKRKVINPDKLKDAENLGQDSVLLCVEGKTIQNCPYLFFPYINGGQHFLLANEGKISWEVNYNE